MMPNPPELAHKDRDADRVKLPSVVATLGARHDGPWWWDDVQKDPGICALHYERLAYKGKYSQHIRTWELPFVALLVLRRLFAWRRKYEYVFTFECDLVGFAAAFWQTVLFQRKPRHVILQFIMRERQHHWRSRLKYAVMRFIFASVHRVVVSSAAEVQQYAHDFGWSEDKLAFVPLMAPARLLTRETRESDYVIAAGRSFRDYPTLLAAIKDTGLKLVLVGGAGIARQWAPNDWLTVYENIPEAQLEDLVAAAQAVVVPLQGRKISIGQSVIVQAMALGKPVIATAIPATADYIDDMQTGILVPPGDVTALRNALELIKDPNLRKRLGCAARAAIAGRNVPQVYSRTRSTECPTWCGRRLLT